MPKRNDIKRILIIGAGPIIIGQACEFDYSGTQACKALREDGYYVILVNSNPATIMTDPNTADSVYIEPITPECIERIIQKEKPDAVLPTVGGQTGLNCAMDLYKAGIFEKYNVKMIGASAEAIEKAENRKQFNDAMARIGLEVPRNAVVKTIEEAREALKTIGLPAIIRPSFTLGGSGGGIATTTEEFEEIAARGLDLSPVTEVLIDESILGWKEYEMEVIRDKADNAIIVCSIENFDPMGVHTGDSITVAPALTLTDKEYQIMRDASIAVLREIGVETGGSNVQFAVNPKDGRLVVIEMNPRVSRSSALASKATGFPIAKVAAKLAIGYTLDEIQNDITQVTPASFEPTIDYIVTKIPRFTFEKFTKTPALLTSAMKSVGEAMSIGRSFPESLQKGLRSLETGLTGLNRPKLQELDNNALSQSEKQAIICKSLDEFSPDRILRVAEALRLGVTIDQIHQITHIDTWFLNQINLIVEAEADVIKKGLPTDRRSLLKLKKLGFSDARLAELVNIQEKEVTDTRHNLNLRPVFKTVDTCAAEFEAKTPYLYSCYEGDGISQPECEAKPTNKKKVVILGGGPNRIGQGIEFDYACVHAAFSLAEEDIETIMVNCNPETVSTDYDTSDKLFFEPLTSEDVIEIIRTEQAKGQVLGVIVQFGGQTPLKLSRALEAANIPIIGTSPDKIDLAEDRERFKALLNDLSLTQPKNAICHRITDIAKTIEEVGYPAVLRPSNVLGGRAMEIVQDGTHLQKYISANEGFLVDGAILIDKFLENAVEIDVDALSDGQDVFVAGIMEHIEQAGVHSGDSACSLPPFSLSDKMINIINESTIKLAKALDVVGLMNVQYAVKDEQLYVIEVNPRASRTVPFVAKSTGISIASIAAKLMVGRKLSEFDLTPIKGQYAVKEVVFPFSRFSDEDVLLGPEMKSTGEVMSFDRTFGLAFAKAQLSAGNAVPQSGNILISVQDQDKPAIKDIASIFHRNGLQLFATRGTADYLTDSGVPVTAVNKEKEGGDHLVKQIAEGKFNLIINTSTCRNDNAESFSLRRNALMNRIPYATTVAAAKAIATGVDEMVTEKQEFTVSSLQERLTHT